MTHSDSMNIMALAVYKFNTCGNGNPLRTATHGDLLRGLDMLSAYYPVHKSEVDDVRCGMYSFSYREGETTLTLTDLGVKESAELLAKWDQENVELDKFRKPNSRPIGPDSPF